MPPEQREAFLREITPGGDWYCEHDVLFVTARKKVAIEGEKVKARL